MSVSLPTEKYEALSSKSWWEVCKESSSDNVEPDSCPNVHLAALTMKAFSLPCHNQAKVSWFSETCRGYFQLLIFHGLICCLNKNNERRATMWHSSQKCKKFCKFTIILMCYWKEKLKDNMDVSSVVLKGKKLFS